MVYGREDGSKWVRGRFKVGKRTHLRRWQRSGTTLAAAAANIGSGRENHWQRPLPTVFFQVPFTISGAGQPRSAEFEIRQHGISAFLMRLTHGVT